MGLRQLSSACGHGAAQSDASFAYVSDFHDGVAVARDNSGACFFIDKSGRRIIDALYKDATLFSDGRAWVRSFDDEIIAVDRKGNKVFYAPEAVMVNTFYDGKSVIYTQDGHTKVVDTSGKELFDGKVLSTEDTYEYYLMAGKELKLFFDRQPFNLSVSNIVDGSIIGDETESFTYKAKEQGSSKVIKGTIQADSERADRKSVV